MKAGQHVFAAPLSFIAEVDVITYVVLDMSSWYIFE